MVDNIKSRYFIPQPPHFVRPKHSPAPLSSLFAFQIEGRNAWNDLLPPWIAVKAAEKSLFFAQREMSALGKIPKPSCTPSTSGTATTQNLSTIHCHQPFPTSSLGCFCLQTNPTLCFFDDASMKSFSKFSASVVLFYVICLIFVLEVLVRPFSVSHEAMYSSSSFRISSSSSSSSSCFLLSRTSSTHSFKVSSSSPIFLVRLSS